MDAAKAAKAEAGRENARRGKPYYYSLNYSLNPAPPLATDEIEMNKLSIELKMQIVEVINGNWCTKGN
ncbi:MAG TPA: hypothetical protein V6D10_21900 [Trichocoleus sp.]|jgi:hypothetical protein